MGRIEFFQTDPSPEACGKGLFTSFPQVSLSNVVELFTLTHGKQVGYITEQIFLSANFTKQLAREILLFVL